MDGATPVGVAIDGSGNLFGMTEYGGDGSECEYGTCGTVFELTPGANGQWTESIIYNFCSLPNCATEESLSLARRSIRMETCMALRDGAEHLN